MKKLRCWAGWFVGLFAVAVALSAAGQDSKTRSKPGQEKPARPRSVVTISKETTYITGPLREDGYPDYLVAINDIASKGLTPENNAVVLLTQACGPGAVYADIREKWFEMLGMRPPPEKGQYLVSLSDYVEQQTASKSTTGKSERQQNPNDVVLRQEYVAIERPWASKEFPVLAQWLQANEGPLELVVAASKRPRFYAPVLTEGEPSLARGALLPHVDSLVKATRALLARAMHRLNAGEAQEAQQDLLACHRLARLLSQGPWLVESGVAHRIEAMACRGDAALAHYGHLGAEEAAKSAEHARSAADVAGGRQSRPRRATLAAGRRLCGGPVGPPRCQSSPLWIPVARPNRSARRLSLAGWRGR